MSRARRSRTYGLLAIVAAAGLIAITQAADQPAAKSPAVKPPSTKAAKPAADEIARGSVSTAVEQALDSSTELDFIDTPLKDIAESIAGRHEINMLLDSKALAEAGVTPDTPLTFKINGVSLRSALNLMLAQHDLAFVTASDNALSITTADAAKNKTVQRVYVVRDLIPPVAWRSEFEPPTDTPGEGLIEVVTGIVVPASWDTNGGPGSVAYLNGALVISQTEPIHQQIAKLLADVRAVRLEQSTSGKGRSGAARRQAALRIRKALEMPLDLDFVDAPLKDVIDSLQSKLGIPIQLDSKALADAGVTPDTPIAFAAKQVPASDGLRRMLGEHDLDFVVEDESFVITTADHAKVTVHPVVYAVGDLCGLSDAKSFGDYDSLINTITGIVAPVSWDANGGMGAIAAVTAANAIVCNQTDEIQDQTAALLAQLRAKDCRFSPLSEAELNSMIVRIYKFEGNASQSTSPIPDEKGMQQLIGLVHQLIEPNSWLAGDASISAAPGAIVVRQTPVIQKRIEQFLGNFGALPGLQPPARTGIAIGFGRQQLPVSNPSAASATETCGPPRTDKKR